MDTRDPRLHAAISAVASACRVARSVQQNLDRVVRMTKDDRSPVTVADYAVQALVWLRLQQQLGEFLIVGEEHSQMLRNDSSVALREEVRSAVHAELPDVTADEVLDAIDNCDHDASADSYWTLDPIDGTKGFLRGQQYAIALALIEGGEVVLGVMGCPNLPVDHNASLDAADPAGIMYAAASGEGAWAIDPQHINASPTRIHAALDAAGSIRICESVESGHTKQTDAARIVELLGGQSSPVRLDSQCKYAIVARNQADAYLRLPTRGDYRECIWDHAAGAIISAEAGAIVTDIFGSPLDFSCGPKLDRNRGVICAARPWHNRIIEAISALGIGAPA
jgi:3'(2'), 5'-bisphosphate nucleotidase